MEYSVQRAKLSMMPIVLPLKPSSIAGNKTVASDGSSLLEWMLKPRLHSAPV